MPLRSGRVDARRGLRGYEKLMKHRYIFLISTAITLSHFLAGLVHYLQLSWPTILSILGIGLIIQSHPWSYPSEIV